MRHHVLADSGRGLSERSKHASFKPYPRSAEGRRTVSLPGWLVALLREHIEHTYPRGEAGLDFRDQVGGAYRRTLFRTPIRRRGPTRPALPAPRCSGQIPRR
ncbi:MAG: hypothetical protein QOI36_276 [Pseudonocardiales bacterium]|jgi:hypothetical protein|nr:integrase [Pseudonocardia sp.]MDT7648870.1 hypothetical protein [Pseudonocardiales bacterium]